MDYGENGTSEHHREITAVDKEWAAKLIQRELNTMNDEYSHSCVKEVIEISS